MSLTVSLAHKSLIEWGTRYLKLQNANLTANYFSSKLIRNRNKTNFGRKRASNLALLG